MMKIDRELLRSEALRRAIRRWSEDYTNSEPWRAATWPTENLIAHLWDAGYSIEPLPKTEREKARRHRLKRLARLDGAGDLAAFYSEAQWAAMLLWAGNACVRCCEGFSAETPPTKDHIIPLIHGGDDSIANIQPLCPTCNSAKGATTADHRKPGWWEAVQ